MFYIGHGQNNSEFCFHALALLGNHDDAVEVSQEMFIRVWEARKHVDPERPFYPWFYTILLVSLIRERLYLHKHERYKDVIR